MGLDSFETDGYRTWSDNNQLGEDGEPQRASDFEDEWDIPLHEASSDDEFLADRIREADSLEEICEMFMWLEHTVVSRVAELVDNNVLEVNEVPDVTHPHYNEHELSWYIKQRNQHKTLGSSRSSSSSSSSNDDSDSSGGGALSAFKS